MEDRYRNIPARVRSDLREYVQNGRPVGSFLRAVIAHDLGSVGLADSDNLKILHDLYWYTCNRMPLACVGTYEKYAAWVRHRGLEGLDVKEMSTACHSE